MVKLLVLNVNVSTHCPACSLDGHFVFSVKATDTDPPVTPSSLIVKDQPQCFPVVTTADTAVFKIGVMDCGAKKKVMNKTGFIVFRLIINNVYKIDLVSCRVPIKSALSPRFKINI